MLLSSRATGKGQTTMRRQTMTSRVEWNVMPLLRTLWTGLRTELS